MKNIPYRPEIDGLRAIAILAVLAYHADFGLSGGLAGVDVFFVISGYLITSLLRAEWQLSERIDLWGFYARRIVPALLLVVIVTVLASFFYFIRTDQPRRSRDRQRQHFSSLEIYFFNLILADISIL